MSGKTATKRYYGGRSRCGVQDPEARILIGSPGAAVLADQLFAGARPAYLLVKLAGIRGIVIYQIGGQASRRGIRRRQAVVLL
jgi:hypothetical protein